MLIRNTNDVLMSQAVNKEEETPEIEWSTPQNQIVTSISTRIVTSSSRIVTSSSSRNSNEIIQNSDQGQESFRVIDNGRSSVVSDPGYISSTGSDHSSVLSAEGEASPEDYADYSTTEYNAVISPSNTSLTDVLNDTYIASSRSSSVSEADSTFGPPEDFMPSSPRPNSAAENLEKTLCDRARTLQESSRLKQAIPATMNLSSEQQNSSLQSGNHDQRIDFDMFFDGVLETKYADLKDNNSTSSIFSNSCDRYHRSSVSPFVKIPGNDFGQSQGCSSNEVADDFPLSIEDFCFDEYVFESNSNIQEPIHNHTLSPSSEFISNEMPLQQRPQQFSENTSLQYSRHQDSSSARQPYGFSTQTSSNGVANRRMQSRVFARNSGEKNEAAAASNATDGKATVQTPTSAEEEVWRSYLENPLTAATTAMMSFQGDEDSAAALGLLYDYYKVPREKRLFSYPTKRTDMAQGRALVPQKSIASALPTTGIAPVPQTGMPSSFTGLLDVKKMAEDVATSHPVKSEPQIGRQVFESVAEIVKPHRSTAANASKVKREIVPESPQDLSTAFSESERNLASATTPLNYSTSYCKSNSNTYLSSSTSNYTTLSTYETSLQSSYPVMSSGYASSGEIFEYVMEAPKSLKQKEGDPTMSYINKGQFYCITLRNASDQWKFKSTRVKSVVHIVFGDGKFEEEQQRHWKYWHARQHTVKQRIIDIADYKESGMIYDVDEISHNAISFSWNVTEAAKIFISCNCLSTDFSAQKGIKGLPLLIQIDTYVDGQEIPFHRGVCQIKVFCDKGAERKIRDEERKATKRRQKNSKTSSSIVSDNTSISRNLMTTAHLELKRIVSSSSTSSTQSGQIPPKRNDFVIFKATTDFETRPVLFVPEIPGHSSSSHQSPVRSPRATPSMSPHTTQRSMAESDQSYFGNSENVERCFKRSHVDDKAQGPPSKVSRVDDNERVLLYVRQVTDKVYDGLMLKTPDLNGLKLAIQEKYNCAAEKIKNVFKKSKKGILVRMDDNIVRHYSNEDTFIIDIYNNVGSDDTTHNVTFTEV